MANNNPGRYRKEGREAFVPEDNPESCCPYSNNPNSFWNHRDDWLEGWGEAKKEHRDIILEQEQYENDNWEFEAIKDKILELPIEYELRDILKDIVNLIEAKTK